MSCRGFIIYEFKTLPGSMRFGTNAKLPYLDRDLRFLGYCPETRRARQSEDIRSRMGSVPNTDILVFDDDYRLKFGPGDPDNPYNYSFKRKCYITAIAISLVMNATFASSAPSGTFQGISDDLNVSVEATGLVITLFLLGYCAGPLFWAPLSEFYGRRNIFRISFSLYFAFGFLCAFTPTFAELLVGRFLTGTAASTALTNAPGVLADIWNPAQRGNAMIIFATMTFVGPALGPIVSGFLQLTKTWRWTFYVIYPIVFQQKRGWNAGDGELPLLGVVTGACLGGIALFIQKKTPHVPEDRLPGAMVGGIMFIVAIFWFGWTAEYNSEHWAVLTVAGTFLAMSILLIFVVFINYIVDTCTAYAASALAANTVLRSACAAASLLFTDYMFNALGVGGAASLIGAIGVLLMPMPFIFYRYGAAIRSKSKFAVKDEPAQPSATLDLVFERGVGG
ncbi:hypothetical protein MKX08_002859 [Trichoderma sp. CBMAI-0020]|nr:hypothetical protein MKX08_002859 [Trichoderma sp. CBMAI-0020]